MVKKKELRGEKEELGMSKGRERAGRMLGTQGGGVSPGGCRRWGIPSEEARRWVPGRLMKRRHSLPPGVGEGLGPWGQQGALGLAAVTTAFTFSRAGAPSKHSSLALVRP